MREDRSVTLAVRHRPLAVMRDVTLEKHVVRQAGDTTGHSQALRHLVTGPGWCLLPEE